MATELWALMDAEGWEGVAETKAQWSSNFAPRTMVAGFMNDKAIGAKRLASMPDRITNTINTADGGQVRRMWNLHMCGPCGLHTAARLTPRACGIRTGYVRTG
jgi:hypothetical protein